MTAKTILNVEKPATQAIDSVKALLSWRGRAVDPLPSFVEMGSDGSRCVLVLSNKKDCFYVTTSRACSCPAATFNHGPCKHQRKYFNSPNQGRALLSSAEPPIKQSNHGAWHGRNGPVLDETRLAAKAAPSSPLYVDTTPDTTPAEVAYFERKEAVEFLPAEA